MKIIKVSGTGGKRALSEYIADGIPAARLLALEGGDESGVGAGLPEVEETGGPELEAGLAASGLFPADDVVVLEANAVPAGLEPCLCVFFTEAPLDGLGPRERAAAGSADLVLVEWGPLFEDESDLGVEKAVRSATGAKKVLIFGDSEGRARAFGKALDLSLSRLGGTRMPGDMPGKVTEAVKREAEDNRISCERAHELALELGVPVPVVGRALDLAGIKIVKCRLGCF